ncbi:MAG: hypothetical protein HFJ50_06120 [Clostridia bacterium]|jgi:hypothetical protein|nr:hypothetical protein [Clostridia bacterium]
MSKIEQLERTVKAIFEDFLEPEALKVRQKSKEILNTDSVRITVYIRSAQFTTSPITIIGTAPFCIPTEEYKDDKILMLWEKAVLEAKKFGFESESFPRKTTPYVFSFIKTFKD